MIAWRGALTREAGFGAYQFLRTLLLIRSIIHSELLSMQALALLS
jgi:hypothetical protein